MEHCQACGKEVAEDANSCPHCGKPKNQGTSLILKVGIFLLPPIFAWFTLRKGVSNTARAVAFIWMLIYLGGVGGTQSENPARDANNGASTGKNAAAVVEVIEIQPRQLFAEYESNEIAADNKFKGKYVKLTGRIDDIGKDILDNMYLTLAASDFFGIQVFFNDEDSGAVANLSKGSRVTVVCRVEGLMANVLCRDAALP